MATLSASAIAVETKKDRAVITHLNAQLLLPDESTLSVDMSLDCSSKYQNTGVIVTSDSGAQLMAVAYSALWGKAAGQSILDTWNTKVNKSDPRKPTFIIVSPPSDAQYWSTYSNKELQGSKTMQKRMRLSAPSAMLDQAGTEGTGDDSGEPPGHFGVCGTLSHD